MDLNILPSVILAVAQARSLDSVLDTIVSGIDGQTGVAMARIWLLAAADDCPVCAGGGRETALHLMASSGTSIARDEEWTRTDGRFHRVSLASNLKLARIANTGQAILVRDLEGADWMVDREWAAREKLVGFLAQPLVSKGEVAGVLAVFTRQPPTDECHAWLRTFADHAAVAIANIRTLEEVDRFRRKLELERDYLIEEVAETYAFGEVLGRSAALQKVLRQVELVAGTGAAVLITGESGTGKELIARAIHSRSARHNRALVKVNCSSIPRELFESEFFGHVRGSFTGAVRDRIGRFQLADGGTLFLDEVGDIPLDLQGKLLRVLQEGEFERVGEDRTRQVDVRIIAATNRDLPREAQNGTFRLDLFYRLGVFPIELPPLRERREDIRLLAAHFIRQAAKRSSLPEPRVTRNDIDVLERYGWPGNVRELQNVMERAVILARGGPLSGALRLTGYSPPAEPAGDVRILTESELRDLERDNLIAAVRKAGGRISGKGGAAELLGISPSTLTSRLKALGLNERAGPPAAWNPGSGTQYAAGSPSRGSEPL